MEWHLLRTRAALAKLAKSLKVKDEIVGVNILSQSLTEPIKKIVENAGGNSAAVLAKVESSKEEDFGFNVMTMEYGSMIKAGIIDPAKVTRSAVQNAVSVAMMVLTTEALVTDIPEEKKEMPQMPGGMDY